MKNKIMLIITILLVILFVFFIILFFNINKSDTDNNNNNNNNDINIEKINEYNNPIIPDGFKKVETSSSSWELENGIPKGWNKGLVIEDELGNQFVWVPVDSLQNYENLKYTNTNTNTKYTLAKSNNQENLQIQKYSGFYIARYEAGITQENLNKCSEGNYSVDGIPTSKSGFIPWNYITTDMAIQNSERMYFNESLSSSLITSKQWIYINSWFQKCGYDINNNKLYGNYSNTRPTFTGLYSKNNGKNYISGDNIKKTNINIIIATGICTNNVNNNIYDFYGNLAECTTQGVAYGGYYDNSSISEPFTNTLKNAYTGFRVVLYQK